MEYIAVVILAALTFGVCFLVDKGFQKLFRAQAQHHSGLAVRLSKRFGSIGLILFVLGLAAIFSGLKNGPVLIVGGAVVLLVGIGLVVYYMTYGIFYDADGFVFTTFGKKSVTYRYDQISHQQLYIVQGGNVLVELHMTDGSAVQVQLQLEGATKFMDKAFETWCHQRGIRKEDCAFHDPDNSCWFPVKEDA